MLSVLTILISIFPLLQTWQSGVRVRDWEVPYRGKVWLAGDTTGWCWVQDTSTYTLSYVSIIIVFWCVFSTFHIVSSWIRYINIHDRLGEYYYWQVYFDVSFYIVYCWMENPSTLAIFYTKTIIDYCWIKNSSTYIISYSSIIMIIVSTFVFLKIRFVFNHGCVLFIITLELWV